MGYQLLTAPTVDPLSITEVKLHLRVDFADDDVLIGLLITAVRQYCEHLTARSLCTQKWALVMDCFPGSLGYASNWGQPNSLPGNAVLLEKGPVQSIDSITYIDMASATQTMASSDYVADMSGQLTRITPRFGKIWPIALPQIASATINFTAGYGVAAAVPEGLKSWMKLRIGTLYENREEVISGRSVSIVALPFVDRLLDAYTIRNGA